VGGEVPVSSRRRLGCGRTATPATAGTATVLLVAGAGGGGEGGGDEAGEKGRKQMVVLLHKEPGGQ
jgi:hypothetical protein